MASRNENNQSSVSTQDRILLVEDDEEVAELVQTYLGQYEFTVTALTRGEDVHAGLWNSSDLMILDLNLPGIDGLQVLKNVREFSPLPILVLSAREGEAERVAGLNLGADDYLVKPFSPEELLARVNALLRRARLPSTAKSIKALEVCPDRKMAWLLGEPLDLTGREFELLQVLYSSPGKVFTRQELFEQVWGDSPKTEGRRVDLYVSRLRIKMQMPNNEELLHSVYGVGYRLGD